MHTPRAPRGVAGAPGRLLAAALLAAAFGLGAGLPARADVAVTCAPEVAKFCPTVNPGRGRLTACLASRMSELNPACKDEVTAGTQSFLVPKAMRAIFTPTFRAPLPQACEAPAAEFCPDVPTGDGRIFACLYGHNDRVSSICSGAAQAAVKGQ